MKLWRAIFAGRSGWSAVFWVVLAMSSLGRQTAARPCSGTVRGECTPARPRGPAPDHAARGLYGEPFCRRARRRAADRHDYRSQGAAVGRRKLLLPGLAGRTKGQGPHLDFRRRRQRRPLRSPHGLFRQRDQLHRHRARFRRRLGLRHSQPALIPDRDGDLRPDGEPVVKLDGWDTKAQHNMFNGLKWGPDGWLWGCNGIMSNSRVGKPGTPDPARVAINCGVWRYHPTRAIFEAVAHGTTNPWGLDFDDLGEAFITNCVIPHLFHVVPGAHFQRMYGEDLVPNRYALMETCADHIHWAGGNWTDSREGKGKHGEAGGGHAHVGAMIYLGDNWPDRYRNDVFMCNLHGKRINRDRLERRGSSYVARHEPDFLMANDPWFRGLELKYGPDGAVYMTDWYDTGECHETDADNAHRENGRIYKISYGKAKPVKVDLAGLDDKALARLQLHHNDWYVRTARRLLQERAAAGQDMGQAHRVLREILARNPDATRQFRAVWALYVTGGLDREAARALLDHPSEHVRAWGVRLLCDQGPPAPSTVARFAELARTDPSQKVRLSLASALQRLPLSRALGGR